MAKRTLASCWKQYGKMAQQYLREETPEEKADAYAKMEELTPKVNRDEIGNTALAPLFVYPYLVSKPDVVFTVDLDIDEDIPDWQTRYDEEETVILVHPLSIYAFVEQIRSLDKIDSSSIPDEEEKEFLQARHHNFLVEMAKLPSVYLLFLLLLQRVAYMLEIAHLEKRGGVIEIAEGESYHTMLWAFKELELFARRTYGTNVRAHFGISWYEAEWITGR